MHSISAVLKTAGNNFARVLLVLLSHCAKCLQSFQSKTLLMQVLCSECTAVTQRELVNIPTLILVCCIVLNWSCLVNVIIAGWEDNSDCTVLCEGVPIMMANVGHVCSAYCIYSILSCVSHPYQMPGEAEDPCKVCIEQWSGCHICVVMYLLILVRLKSHHCIHSGSE
jgi:hypothetical protein